MFSVVISTYNRRELLQRALESVLSQNFKDFELIVIDDNSKDGTWEYLNSLEGIAIHRNEENQGLSFNRNLGIRMSKFDYIAFLDDDDYWDENFLSEIKKQIELDAKLSVYSTNFTWFEKDKFTNPKLKLDFKESKENIITYDYIKLSISGNTIDMSNSVFSKEHLNKIKGFDSNLKYSGAEDIEVLTKLSLLSDFSISEKKLCFIDFSHHNHRHKLIKKNTKFFDFSYFEEYEKNNKDLKMWLDLNRFSIARQLKLIGDNKQANSYLAKIDKRNISSSKLWVYKFPTIILRILNYIYFNFVYPLNK